MLVRECRVKSELSYNIPSNLIKTTHPDAITALRILEERGEDPNAAFILWILYQFGLSEFVWINHIEAKKHYEIAEALGCRLIQIWEYLNNNQLRIEGLSVDKLEAIFVNMNIILQINNCNELPEYCEELDDSDIDDLRLISTMGMVYYQGKGSYLSTAILGLLISQDVIILGNENNSRIY